MWHKAQTTLIVFGGSRASKQTARTQPTMTTATRKTRNGDSQDRQTIFDITYVCAWSMALYANLCVALCCLDPAWGAAASPSKSQAAPGVDAKACQASLEKQGHKAK